MKELTRDEISLLLYLETRAVDHGGLIDHRQMNTEDFANARRWNELGFIEFGRVYSKHIEGNLSNWVHLSDEAFALAHVLRRQRAQRQWSKRQFLKSDEQ